MKNKGFSIGIIFLVLMVCTTCTKDEALLTPDGELSALKKAKVENATISVAAIDALIQKIEDYVPAELEPGIANSLISKLENAKKSLEKGNEKAAMNQLQAVINQLNGLVGAGAIDIAIGEELIFDVKVITGECTTCGQTFIDSRDNREYKTVLIGDQCWKAENLKATTYNDRTTIPLVTDNTEWNALSTPAYCWYNNDEATYKPDYGALYNWYVVETGKLCPAGWHVPSYGELLDLFDHLGGMGVAGGKLKATGTLEGGDGLWWAPNLGATNETGFTALPSGHRFGGIYDGRFGFINGFTHFWSTTEYPLDPTKVYSPQLAYSLSNVSNNVSDRKMGLSVRCIKD